MIRFPPFSPILSEALHRNPVLAADRLVSLANKGSYGAVLFLTAKMEEALPILDEIWSRIGTRKISATAKE